MIAVLLAVLPAWLQLVPGAHAVATSEEGDVTWIAVCASVAKYVAEDAHCRHVSQGTPAIVEAVIPNRVKTPADPYGTPFVKLRAIDGSWSGYTSASSIAPAIPPGVTLLLTRAPGEEVMRLAPSENAGSDAGVDLGARAKVVVLRYDPSSQDRELDVRVLDGRYAGRAGWVYRHSASALNGVYAGALHQP